MTRVERSFQLREPLAEEHLERIARLHSLYGILRVRPQGDASLWVEFDATRLTPKDVEAAIASAGIPIVRDPPLTIAPQAG